MRRTCAIMGMVLLLSSGSAVAQVFPPPANQPPPGPDVKPPPPQVRPPSEQPRRQPPAANRPEVPDVPYVPMVQRGEDGRVIELTGNLDLLALRHNPLVRGKALDDLRPHVAAWRNRLDRMVIDYADIVLDLENGWFANMDFADDSQVYIANHIIMAMVAGGNLTKYLEDHGALSKPQAAFNQRIVQEYRTALYREKANEIAARHGANSQDALVEVTRITFSQLCADALWSFRRQLLDVASRAAEVLPAAGINREITSKWQKSLAESDDHYETVKRLFGELEYEQQAAILKAALATTDMSFPELDAAKNKPEGTGEPPTEDVGG